MFCCFHSFVNSVNGMCKSQSHAVGSMALSTSTTGISKSLVDFWVHGFVNLVHRIARVAGTFGWVHGLTKFVNREEQVTSALNCI